LAELIAADARKAEEGDDSDKNGGTSTTARTKATGGTDVDLLTLANTSGRSQDNKNARRRAYTRVEKSRNSLKEHKNPNHSMVVATSVILAQELRKLKTAVSCKSATAVLRLVSQIITPSLSSDLELRMPYALCQAATLNSGRRKYMAIRQNQLRISDANPLLLPPYGRMHQVRLSRRPKHRIDGKFCPPVPMDRGNCGEDRSVVSPLHSHGPDGILQILRPTDARHPYCPSVYYRFGSVLDCTMEQEVYVIIMRYCEDRLLNIENFLWSLIVMGGGDGSNCEKLSAKASTHYIAYGVTVAVVIARCKDKNGFPVVCTDSNHRDYGSCVACNQHQAYCHPCECNLSCNSKHFYSVGTNFFFF